MERRGIGGGKPSFLADTIIQMRNAIRGRRLGQVFEGRVDNTR